MDLADRHPGVRAIMRHFAYDHLPPDLRGVGQACHDLAWRMVAALPDDPQLTAGLHRLLEAKDCFVRAMLLDEEDS